MTLNDSLASQPRASLAPASNKIKPQDMMVENEEADSDKENQGEVFKSATCED
jgi:hypothetical protein